MEEMLTMTYMTALWALPVLLSGLTWAAGTQSTSRRDASRSLQELFAKEWDYEMERHPTVASELGDRRWNDRWEDRSLEAMDRHHRHDLAVLKKLALIPRSSLSAADRLNYDLFKLKYDTAVAGHRYRWHLIPVNQLSGIQNCNELSDSLRFGTTKDYEDWIARMKAFPRYTDQTIRLMREGMQARMVLPRVVMQRISGQIDRQLVTDPEESPFYKPFHRYPAEISARDQERLSGESREAVLSSIIPSMRKFRTFFLEEYLPSCFDAVGAWQMPEGEAMYAHLARQHTTTALTPGEIHEIGLREVARIRGEMSKIIGKIGFKGTFEEFLTFLRTDPRFYYTTPDDLLTAYRAVAKRIDPHLVKLFGILPRTPYGVEPVPATTAPDNTTAYYREPAADGSRGGTYFVNLYRPETRPKYEIMALSLHEAVPGHHLQIALAMEQERMPKFRRHGSYTAFVEGWALYAESLGEELGLYDDDYSKFGELTYEMWRAARLVVDTGIHAKRWDRQQAIDYFMRNAGKAELDVINEIDRYIVWPGQALAYKIGELKLRDLRQRAQESLGERFDLREFHDVILGSGALPLATLEQIVDSWLRRKRSSAGR